MLSQSESCHHFPLSSQIKTDTLHFVYTYKHPRVLLLLEFFVENTDVFSFSFMCVRKQLWKEAKYGNKRFMLQSELVD
jgi:hypothetical protein